MAEAAQLQRRRAGERGPEAVQRVALLRLRFQENLPIRPLAVGPNEQPVDLALYRHNFVLICARLIDQFVGGQDCHWRSVSALRIRALARAGCWRGPLSLTAAALRVGRGSRSTPGEGDKH